MNRTPQIPEAYRYDYDNTGWPRDFDIRIEVAEQQEVLLEQRKSLETAAPVQARWHTSEYDF